jgi:group I intron endonuclease
MIGIYKITSPSSKIYIGQSIDIERRFKNYKSLSQTKKQVMLHYSFKKYGINNHLFEIIEQCSIESLNIRERYWQDYYNVIEDGLNCLLT